MKPFAWSFSSLELFEQCPWRWNLVKHTKEVTEAPYDHRSEGNVAHKALENAIKTQALLPPALTKFQPVVDRIRKSKGSVEVERKIALTSQLTPTTYFAPDAWFRVAFDVRVALPDKTVVLDWKYGKRKTNPDQLKLYAAVEFKIRPAVEKVQTGYVWLKHGKLDQETYTRDDAPIIWSEFTQRVARIEHAIKTNNFPKRPSGLCREYCPVGRNRCEHCGT